MSFDIVPPKVEVMGWNARTLADYMKRLKLSGCDKVVMKGSITGVQFMQMTESELQVFPTIHIPMITMIHSNINRGEEKRVFGQRSKASKYPTQDFAQEEEAWESDEFEKESDNDYEEECEDEEDGYICALSEPGQRDSEEGNEDDYETPPSTDTKELPQRLSLAKPLGHGDYIDSVHVSPADRAPRPPHHHKQSPQTGGPSRSNLAHPPLPRKDCAPQRPLKAPGRAPAGLDTPHVDRGRKPGQSGLPKKGHSKSRDGGPFNSLPLSTSKLPQLKGPKPPDHSNRSSKCSPAPASPVQGANVHNSALGHTKGMDPRWYGGQVTRRQAEVVLRQDGAFVVRDSSKGLSEQPYTLMVLNQGKVYNIQIRNHGNSYSLGTGLKNSESFPGVKEMISHHTHTPLLLIDATDRSSGAQSQCCLLHPVGF
ncbi:lymphocyte cytosolic protein 2 isoform X2 [Centroberyx affinis]|uniref:lymphocyte cytosolic protein 2 isoform X2 n=1 Tax=Centroberyx affinis TaxID=166261 RepID=UPI003A5C5ABE